MPSSVFITILALALAFFIEREVYTSLESLITAVNMHAGGEDYAVIVARIKFNKKRDKKKIWINCDRRKKSKNIRDEKYIHESIKLLNCFFKITAKKFEDINDWMLTIKIFFHNHIFTFFKSHSALRKITLNEKIIDVIKRQSRVNILPIKILFELRFDINEENSMFKS